MERIHIRPRQLKPAEAIQFGLDESERLHVLDPMTRRELPKDGQVVVQTSYWVRLLAKGDVEHVTPAPRARGRSRSASEEE